MTESYIAGKYEELCPKGLPWSWISKHSLPFADLSMETVYDAGGCGISLKPVKGFPYGADEGHSEGCFSE